MGVRVSDPVDAAVAVVEAVVQGTPLPPVLACSPLAVLSARDEGDARTADTPDPTPDAVEDGPGIAVALRVRMPRTVDCGGVSRAAEVDDTLEEAATRAPFNESAPTVV